MPVFPLPSSRCARKVLPILNPASRRFLAVGVLVVVAFSLPYKGVTPVLLLVLASYERDYILLESRKLLDLLDKEEERLSEAPTETAETPTRQWF